MNPALPGLGFGLGLRPPHYEALRGGPLQQLRREGPRPRVDWLELISENYLAAGGRPAAWLEALRADYPMALHGVSLSIGGSDPLDQAYLRGLRQLADQLEAAWVSDHLCWTGIHGTKLHDLLPLPLTEETLRHVVARVGEVQEQLGRRLLLENVSSYVRCAADEYPEPHFLAELAERADCLLLLDLNNIWVSAHHGGVDPHVYLQTIPADRVQQFHLAGQADGQTIKVDTHDGAVSAPVWDLYVEALRRFGAVSTLLERDAAIPALPELVVELDHARQLAAAVAGGREEVRP
ncbi:MNIO family bufferin maturase [Frateuria aurantia]